MNSGDEECIEDISGKAFLITYLPRELNPS
jgi:hypothetical protein